jgi:hypothetical protein
LGRAYTDKRVATAFDMDSILKLARLIREGAQHANGTSKSEQHFLDFVVDGKSLWEALGERHDMVSILCSEYSSDETAKAVGPPASEWKADLPNDRRSFFVYSECGDLGCAAITAVVERQGEKITWKAFGYENTYEDKMFLDASNTVGHFTFDATAYEHTLAQALDVLRRALASGNWTSIISSRENQESIRKPQRLQAELYRGRDR